ncbi:DUF3667 domain-containing protein [Pseudochryseolinea flava]|uniref:DUF3667 domain-containing protein n=1 Tax=Pseudochryseolinea flava TaxID=2059302 RepID=A0A364XVX5_9BACT|nr:DUF3667 domain-containing protein [Pseudochryseolinea flava]RAV98304.1 hypothetical protein DQQ10_24450 [Pseudochryseolinea flava]
MTVCKNCDTAFDGKFCSNCGQNAHVHRITVGHMAHELSHAITHADKGFLLLVKELLYRPGFVAKEYLEGRRKKYFNPFSFLVIMSALSAFITYKSGYLQQAGDGHRGPSNMYYQEAMQLSINYGKLIGLVVIVPLYALISWLFFWKPRYNYAEHFVLQSYSIGMYYVVSVLIFIPAFLLMPGTFQINNMVLHLIYAIYMGVTYHQFFKKNLFVCILKALVMTVVFIAAFWYLLVGYIWLKHLIIDH